jgi:chromosome segregation ATPase
VDALLKADPRSAQLKTHFSELPIHIACGFGASEEVIGILLSAYPDGIVEIDQAKRTPLDCFLMARRPKDSVTFRSMERCIAYISERNKALEKATEKIGTEHAAQVANLEKNLLEQEKKTMLEISSLQNVISEKKLLIDNLESSLRSCQDTLELKLQVEAALTETVAHLENTNEVAQAKISHCITNIKELNTALEDKDCQMVFLTDKVKKTEAQVVLLMDTQKKLENHAAKRKVYAKKEEQEWKNMLSLMESQRKTAEETFEQILST